MRARNLTRLVSAALAFLFVFGLAVPAVASPQTVNENIAWSVNNRLFYVELEVNTTNVLDTSTQDGVTTRTVVPGAVVTISIGDFGGTGLIQMLNVALQGPDLIRQMNFNTQSWSVFDASLSNDWQPSNGTNSFTLTAPGTYTLRGFIGDETHNVSAESVINRFLNTVIIVQAPGQPATTQPTTTQPAVTQPETPQVPANRHGITALENSPTPTMIDRITIDVIPGNNQPATLTLTNVASVVQWTSFFEERQNLGRPYYIFFYPGATIVPSANFDIFFMDGDKNESLGAFSLYANTVFYFDEVAELVNGFETDNWGIGGSLWFLPVSMFDFVMQDWHVFGLIDDLATDSVVEGTENFCLLSASAWAHDNINEAFELGLIPQELFGSFSSNINRRQFAALAVYLYEKVRGEEIAGRMEFTDTNDINVQKMGYLGVISGVGDGRFDPWANLTREQAATMLARLAYAIGQPLPPADPTFADNTQISSWAIEAVGQMQATGIMGGVGDNLFAPGGDYTREQSIVTILRMFDMLD